MKTQALLLSLFAIPLFACSSGNGATPAVDAGHDQHARDAGVPSDAPGKEAAAPVILLDPLSVVPGSAQEHEPFIAVSPGGRVAVSFLSFLSSGTAYTEGYRISNDRGATWGSATLFAVPSGDNVQANASVAAGDDDTLYMAWAAEDRTETGRANEHVFVATSPKGSTTFGTPVEVSDPSVPVSVYDQPRISVTHAGVIDVGYLLDSADGNTAWLQMARSTDGKSWTRSFAAGPGSYQSFRNEARFCRPSGEGRIFLLYLDSDVADCSYDLAVALRYSDDDGATWSLPIDVTSEADELILDPTANLGCTTDGTDVWMVYGLTPEANLGGADQDSPVLEHTMTRLRLAHSGDGGKTIDARSDVLDTRAGTKAMYPVLVGEGQGTLDLSYYVGNADNDPKAALRRTRSLDGKTFPPSVLVHEPLTLETSRSDPRWVGDYVGGAFQGGDVFLVFTDNSTATPHIAFYRTPAALPGGPSEPDAAAPPSDGGSEAGCYTGAVFAPVPWAPPTAFAQGACTPAQVTAYLACQGSGDCTAFRVDSTNAACLACVETDVGAAAHGPIVTRTGDAGVSILEVNYGGCQAHFDGHSAKGSCGDQSNDFNDCVNAECETCSDFQSPSQYGPTYDCYYTAIDVGVCTAYRETTPCSYETLVDGSADACNDPSVFVPLWCGM